MNKNINKCFINTHFIHTGYTKRYMKMSSSIQLTDVNCSNNFCFDPNHLAAVKVNKFKFLTNFREHGHQEHVHVR